MRIARDARRGDVAITEWIALSLRTGGMECRHRLRTGAWAGRRCQILTPERQGPCDWPTGVHDVRATAGAAAMIVVCEMMAGGGLRFGT